MPPPDDACDVATTPAPDALSIFDDTASRSVLLASDAPSTAKELADACDFPLSTVCRKLNRLTEASLVDQTTRARRHGKHPQQYQRRADVYVVRIEGSCRIDLVVSLDD